LCQSYNWQHELRWYAAKKTSKDNWSEDRKQTTHWQIANKGQDCDVAIAV